MLKMKMMRLIKFSTVFMFFGLISCDSTNEGDAKFELLSSDATGLNFTNDPQQTEEFNVFNYMYFFNGGGVSVGDFNNDGLQDVYLTSNREENAMFLNVGDMQFKEVTAEAGVIGLPGWTSGTTVVDINNDGLLDLYISQVSQYESLEGQNQLYICQKIENGVPIYEDQAKKYGLDFQGFATQSAFFDFDLDGDLDIYQLNHSVHHNSTFGKRSSFSGKKHPTSGDRLLRNDNGQYVDVSEEAKIETTAIGYGLGICISDINLDGWPDVYIGNDFHENDYLYINQKDGTFKESTTEQLRHTSRFSMGVDMADINNDGLSEIISLDMAPDDPYILKTSLGEDAYGIFKFKLGFGYNHQYARNNLQLNNGDETFSEIGIYAGVDATDWSWAPLMFDFDHDGYKDIFVSNGIPRRMNDIDYVKFRTSDPDVKFKTANNVIQSEDDMKVVEMMPKIKLTNRFFRNDGKLRFDNLESFIEGDRESFSNGAAYADFDNDGDLDVIVNNIEDEPFVYRNLQSDSLISDYLFILPRGNPENVNAIGSKLFAFKGIEMLVAENYPTKGFQSSVQNGIHLGLGDGSKIDSVFLIWPDNSFEKITAKDFNNTVKKTWKAGLPKFDFPKLSKSLNEVAVEDISEESGLDFIHEENPFIEFNREKLVPAMVSAEGPAIAVGDLNGDGLDDVFFGGAKRKRSELYFQSANGKFILDTPLSIINDSIYEDIDAVVVDIDDDGDNDLVVASGGNEWKGKSEYRQQRVYINDGKDGFERTVPFEDTYMTASCVLPADYNNDGLIDFFFGGRAVVYAHGLVPESYLFKNLGGGKFENVTEQVSNDLLNVGMVKNGAWSDVDQDGDQDLLLAVEWEPIKVLMNENGNFKEMTFNNLKGWWNFVLPYDFDQDGDIDILAGNTGENSKLNPSDQELVKMYVADFDGDEQTEPILTYFKSGKEIPFANYEELTTQMPGLKKKFLYAKEFANASLADLFGQENLDQAVKHEANYFSSAYFENTGNGLKFKTHALPSALQFSTLQAANVSQTNANSTEVIAGGNFYDCNIEMGRYDANFGNMITIGPNGEIKLNKLGDVRIEGQVKKINKVTSGEKTTFLIGVNDAPVIVLEKK